MYNNAIISPEQQEKVFQKILKRPENQFCADCNAKSPKWVSIDFGVFICMDCSGAHRSLGPSVTRVRSTELDKWHVEDVELMHNIGNQIANQYWENNSKGVNKKINPSSTIDERIQHVNNKYIKKFYAVQNDCSPVQKYNQNQLQRKSSIFSNDNQQQTQEQYQIQEPQYKQRNSEQGKLPIKAQMPIRRGSNDQSQNNKQLANNMQNQKNFGDWDNCWKGEDNANKLNVVNQAIQKKLQQNQEVFDNFSYSDFSNFKSFNGAPVKTVKKNATENFKQLGSYNELPDPSQFNTFSHPQQFNDIKFKNFKDNNNKNCNPSQQNNQMNSNQQIEQSQQRKNSNTSGSRGAQNLIDFFDDTKEQLQQKNISNQKIQPQVTNVDLLDFSEPTIQNNQIQIPQQQSTQQQAIQIQVLSPKNQMTQNQQQQNINLLDDNDNIQNPYNPFLYDDNQVENTNIVNQPSQQSQQKVNFNQFNNTQQINQNATQKYQQQQINQQTNNKNDLNNQLQTQFNFQPQAQIQQFNQQKQPYQQQQQLQPNLIQQQQLYQNQQQQLNYQAQMPNPQYQYNQQNNNYNYQKGGQTNNFPQQYNMNIQQQYSQMNNNNKPDNFNQYNINRINK